MTLANGGGGGGSLTEIFSQTLQSSGSFTVSNIPQGYSDLLAVFSCSSNANAATDSIDIQFNGDGGSNYNSTLAIGTNTAATQFAQNTWDAIIAHSAIAGSTLTGYLNLLSLCEVYIPRYSANGITKVVKVRGTEGFGVGSGAVNTMDGCCFWNSTAPITSLSAFAGATPFTFVPNSQLRLYGVM